MKTSAERAQADSVRDRDRDIYQAKNGQSQWLTDRRTDIWTVRDTGYLFKTFVFNDIDRNRQEDRQ